MSEPASHHDEEVLGKAYDSRLMRRLLAYVRPYAHMAGSLMRGKDTPSPPSSAYILSSIRYMV
jgi:hypothetical protein